MRYRNAPAAIDWLCEVFSFTRQLVVPGPDGTVIHSQLVMGTGMVMVSSVRDDHYGSLVKQPDEFGGLETQACCLIVEDPDAVYHRLLTHRGTIVRDIQDEPYGGRAFTGRDLEGHLWTVGSYNPWA